MARARIVLKLGGELLERPEDVARVAKAIAALSKRAALVVVHGFLKKSQKTPKGDIEIALKRKGEFSP